MERTYYVVDPTTRRPIKQAVYLLNKEPDFYGRDDPEGRSAKRQVRLGLIGLAGLLAASLALDAGIIALPLVVLLVTGIRLRHDRQNLVELIATHALGVPCNPEYYRSQAVRQGQAHVLPKPLYASQIAYCKRREQLREQSDRNQLDREHYAHIMQLVQLYHDIQRLTPYSKVWDQGLALLETKADELRQFHQGYIDAYTELTQYAPIAQIAAEEQERRSLAGEAWFQMTYLDPQTASRS